MQHVPLVLRPHPVDAGRIALLLKCRVQCSRFLSHTCARLHTHLLLPPLLLLLLPLCQLLELSVAAQPRDSHRWLLRRQPQHTHRARACVSSHQKSASSWPALMLTRGLPWGDEGSWWAGLQRTCLLRICLLCICLLRTCLQRMCLLRMCMQRICLLRTCLLRTHLQRVCLLRICLQPYHPPPDTPHWLCLPPHLPLLPPTHRRTRV